MKKLNRNKNSVRSWGGGWLTIEELSKLLKNTDKTTKNDLIWNKELREDLQFICFLRRNSIVHITVK